MNVTRLDSPWLARPGAESPSFEPVALTDKELRLFYGVESLVKRR